MILKRIRTFLEKKGFTGLYCGKCLATVPEGSLVLFPYDPAVINCGITGMLSFKRRSAKTVDSPVQELARMVEGLAEHTWNAVEEKGAGLEEQYLGGEGVLGEIKRLCGILKTEDSFHEVFSNNREQDQLSALCSTLQGLIETEEDVVLDHDDPRNELVDRLPDPVVVAVDVDREQVEGLGHVIFGEERVHVLG